MKKSIVIEVSQATRDAFGHLLVARYLQERGVSVQLANQGTLIAICERVRPQVVFASWLPTGRMMDYLESISRRTRVALMDQEAAKIGEKPYKRSFEVFDGGKARFGKMAAKVFLWGKLQARWLMEVGILKEDQIAVTGSPKLDPYLLERPAPPPEGRHIGFTLRYEPLTARPRFIMEHIFEYAQIGGLVNWIGYPPGTQHEDQLWHVAGAARAMFQSLGEAARRTQARLIVRPGPWEQPGVYAFLSKKLPQVTVDSCSLQHDYIRGACAIFDEASSMGVEALVAGVPVITTQELIPHLKERIGAAEAGIYNAFYIKYFWRPSSTAEAGEMARKAVNGQLPPTPTSEGLADYLKGLHDWPRARPAAFTIGDVLLGLLEQPENPVEAASSTKHWLYRHVPGAATAFSMRMYAQNFISKDQREHLLRYHYFPWSYPHHEAAREMHERLSSRYS